MTAATNPIWLTLEYASTVFGSDCVIPTATPYSAPNIPIVASGNPKSGNATSSGRKRMSASTLAFTTAPLITAAAGIGAAVYASGIQKCSGTNPAFMPRPMINNVSVRSRVGEVTSACVASLISRLPFGVAAASSTRPASRNASASSARPR